MESAELTGPEKSAILLLILGEDIAALLLKYLSDQEVQRISNYMSHMREVDAEVGTRILEEFYEMVGGVSGMIAGGKEYVKTLLLKALDPEKAKWIIDNLSVPILETGLEALRWLDPKTIARFLQSEHPQTIAVIVAHLDPPQAGIVLSTLPPTLRGEVVLRIAKLERIPPGVIQELDTILQNELKATGALETGKVGGVQAVAEILNNVDQASEREIMGQIEEANASLAEEIRQLMFVFEDLITVDDRGMQMILKEIAKEDLTLSMKTASEGLREKIFRNMSQRAAEMLQEEIEMLGPVRINDVEKAQQKITQVAKRLEAEGKIMLSRKGENTFV
ncbi:MAG TPA: flagellar motor switch protein FliG [Candidatus Tectomicrobia bacterium]|jgi:flagellar motor switch protein FliG